MSSGRWARLALFAVLTALGTIAGCSSPPAPTPIVFEGRLPFDPGPDVGGRSLQNEAFADGKVTFDEYERAMTAAIQCMREAGYEVDGPLRYPDGPMAVEPGTDPTQRLSYRARVGDDPADRFGEASGRCLAQWVWAIEQEYFKPLRPTEREIQEWLERAWACGAERGAKISSPPSVEEAMDSVRLGCRPWEDGA